MTQPPAQDGPESSLPLPDAAVLASVRDPNVPLGHLVGSVLGTYGDRPALFWRESKAGRLASSFSSLSFAELHDQVQAVQALLTSPSGYGLKSGESLAIVAFAGPEYVATVLAAMAAGLVTAPLQTSSKSDLHCAIAKEVAPLAIFASAEQLPIATDMALAANTTRLIVVLDHDQGHRDHLSAFDDAERKLKEGGSSASLLSFTEACVRGAELPVPAPYVAPAGSNLLSAIYYTSGSTGTPKGAMYLESHTRAFWAMASDRPQVILHYQPMNHTFGMSWVCMVLASGGHIYFTARSDLSTLLVDMTMARPTNIALVPRVCELIHQRATADKRAGAEHDFAALRESLLGGRVKAATTGSAPLASELKHFIEQVLGFPLLDGYGTTETGMIALDGVIQSPPVTAFRLLDVPQLGYFSTDKPFPRGELAVRSKRLISGYFGRDDLNATLVDAEGFYHTGDIMEEVAPGTIRYLDRRNNVLKLAQGEFVAIAKLEALFAAGSPAIRQIYLYGNSARAFLLGVVVLNQEALPVGLDDDHIRMHVMNAIRETGTAMGLAAYEIPRDVIIEQEPFSIANGLLAGVGKYLRPALNARYQGKLEAHYARIAQVQVDELANLRENAAILPIEQVVMRGAVSVLGLGAPSHNPRGSFAELGGDSLSAISFSLLLEELYDVPVEVGEILNPAGSFARLAENIATARSSGGEPRASFLSVHGQDGKVLRASDLTIDRFLASEVLASADQLEPVVSGEPDTVVLTGANGFLGRFLCLELLEKLAKTGGQLVCICRGHDDADAARRLRQGFDSGDAELLARFDELAEGRLEVLAGDLAQSRLGLNTETWSTLSQTADLIVHPAALVNHRMSYRQLFQPNVCGTAEIIALALTGRRKPIVNVSTIAAASAFDGAVINEDADIRTAIPEWSIGDEEGYAEGYAASKWAAEVLLRDAAERFGIPVVTFRSNMILAHRHYCGQINATDIFTRLLISLALTGIAPASFYSGASSRAHYEGLPVDFIARAIISIGHARRFGCHTFHVLNPHDDGISLDTFVDWIVAAGISISRLSVFSDWRLRFEQALRALPEGKRAATSLPVMSMFDCPMPTVAGTRMPVTHFIESVDELMAGDGIPQIDRNLIEKYLADITSLRLIEH